MNRLTLYADSYFDGQRFHDQGPYRIDIADAVIRQIAPASPQQVAAAIAPGAGEEPDAQLAGHAGAPGSGVRQVIHAPFVMPGLVEGHCHLFLDGNELDLETRKQYLSAPREVMQQTGWRSLQQYTACGITLARDAGDLHGINSHIRGQLRQTPGAIQVRSPGRALRKAGRYGSFMGVEVTDSASILAAIEKLAPEADDLKILLTGIIDFEKGQMKGGVQFDLEQTRLIAAAARKHGLRTYAHCSGMEGLTIAVDAGLDSIEHGFFMERSILQRMADQGIAWVPTFSPVYFQWERTDVCSWSEETRQKLWAILQRHFENVALACELGAAIVAGSDAGSYGVPHGKGLIDELFFLRRGGMGLAQVLQSATSLPRRLWNCPSADVAAGAAADLVVLAGNPQQDLENLRRVQLVIRGASVAACSGVPAAQPG